MAASIKVIRLTNGDDIIGIVYDGMDEALTEDDVTTIAHLFFVRGSMKVLSEYNKDTQAHALYLVDWFPSVLDDVIPIDKRNVLTMGNPHADLEQYYCELMMLSLENALEDTQEDKKKSQYKDILKKHNFDDDDMQ